MAAVAPPPVDRGKLGMTAARLYARLVATGLGQRYIRLRARFYGWLFGTPTTVLEAMNALLLLGWAGALLDDRLLTLPVYVGLAKLAHIGWANEALAALFLIAAAFAGVGALADGPRSDKLAGYALQLGAVLWLCVAANFLASYPPLNTGVLVYGVIGAFCWVSGSYLWAKGRQGDKLPDEGQARE